MRVWGYPDRRSLLISTGDSIDTVEWPSGSVPTEVYVEASSYAAGFINSKYLRLYYTGVDCNTIPPTKYIVDRVPQAEIYFTFVEVDMDMAGVKDNYYETLEVTEEMVPGVAPYSRGKLCAVRPKERPYLFVNLVSNTTKHSNSLRFAALDCCWVFEAPVNPLGASRKYRAVVTRVIADRYHVIERLALELLYGFRALTRNIDAEFLHDRNCLRAHLARIRAGTRDFVCSAAFVPEQALTHLASSRVAST